ncbi:DUF4936 family protein [Massilia arenosa]|uniref:DUF4936 family protein n=1 Tax=Zemynaea arenosa TaxID=2561931 RepID=A0A4Y9RVZ2_9BURK|nr:DUF4936 family protein [Massilia arenosa]TFW11468.1 DUF4936 family protein [Massilia arenosa]
MTDLYIYYRVPAGQAGALASKVRAMQAALGGGQLKRRPGEKDGLQTWMEVYASVTDDFPARLDRAAEEAGLQQHIDGLRHTEVFTDFN